MGGVIAPADAETVAVGRFTLEMAAVELQRPPDPGLHHDTLMSEVFQDRIACADAILLTKTDLAGVESVVRVRAMIAAEWPRKRPILTVIKGVIDARPICGIWPGGSG